MALEVEPEADELAGGSAGEERHGSRQRTSHSDKTAAYTQGDDAVGWPMRRRRRRQLIGWSHGKERERDTQKDRQDVQSQRQGQSAQVRERTLMVLSCMSWPT